MMCDVSVRMSGADLPYIFITYLVWTCVHKNEIANILSFSIFRYPLLNIDGCVFLSPKKYVDGGIGIFI